MNFISSLNRSNYFTKGALAIAVAYCVKPRLGLSLTAIAITAVALKVLLNWIGNGPPARIDESIPYNELLLGQALSYCDQNQGLESQLRIQKRSSVAVEPENPSEFASYKCPISFGSIKEKHRVVCEGVVYDVRYMVLSLLREKSFTNPFTKNQISDQDMDGICGVIGLKKEKFLGLRNLPEETISQYRRRLQTEALERLFKVEGYSTITRALRMRGVDQTHRDTLERQLTHLTQENSDPTEGEIVSEARLFAFAEMLRKSSVPQITEDFGELPLFSRILKQK